MTTELWAGLIITPGNSFQGAVGLYDNPMLCCGRGCNSPKVPIDEYSYCDKCGQHKNCISGDPIDGYDPQKQTYMGLPLKILLTGIVAGKQICRLNPNNDNYLHLNPTKIGEALDTARQALQNSPKFTEDLFGLWLIYDE